MSNLQHENLEFITIVWSNTGVVDVLLIFHSYMHFIFVCCWDEKTEPLRSSYEYITNIIVMKGNDEEMFELKKRTYQRTFLTRQRLGIQIWTLDLHGFWFILLKKKIFHSKYMLNKIWEKLLPHTVEKGVHILFCLKDKFMV